MKKKMWWLSAIERLDVEVLPVVAVLLLAGSIVMILWHNGVKYAPFFTPETLILSFGVK